MSILRNLAQSFRDMDILEEIVDYIDCDLVAISEEFAIIAALYKWDKLDTDDYLLRYDDISNEQMDPLYHFVVFGMHENRKIHIKNRVSNGVPELGKIASTMLVKHNDNKKQHNQNAEDMVARLTEENAMLLNQLHIVQQELAKFVNKSKQA